jgi:hypothetical protein
MKKKQRDDIMGEDESSLPINDGELVFVSKMDRKVTNRLCYSAWWVPRVPVQKGIFLPATNKEC